VPREDQLVSGVLLHDASTAGLAQELLGAAAQLWEMAYSYHWGWYPLVI